MEIKQPRIKRRAKKAKKWLDKIKTHKSDKAPFEGSMGVAISAIRNRKKRIKEELGE